MATGKSLTPSDLIRGTAARDEDIGAENLHLLIQEPSLSLYIGREDEKN